MCLKEVLNIISSRCNDTQHYDTHQNDTQHDGLEYNIQNHTKGYDLCSMVLLCVSHFVIIILSAIMLCVVFFIVMLIVVVLSFDAYNINKKAFLP
jgi:Flp pilus assembly protein TadB